jgi:hypothetical protein
MEIFTAWQIMLDILEKELKKKIFIVLNKFKRKALQNFFVNDLEEKLKKEGH